MEIPALIAHLAPLMSATAGSGLPDRLGFLLEAAGPVIPADRMDHWYQVFVESSDFEAASAAAGAGTASVWDSGNDFGRFEDWIARIEDLLGRKDGISPLARSSLHGFRGLAELTGQADLGRAERSFAAQRNLAEEAGSRSLRVFSAAARSYPLVWAGRLPEARLLLNDAAPLAPLPETFLVCRIYFSIALGSFRLAEGDIPEARRILEEAAADPLFGLLPPSVLLLGNSHRLMAAAFGKEATRAEDLYRRILDGAVPAGNHFHHGYCHFNLGIASILLGRPHQALLHGRESGERGRKSQSPVPEIVSALVVGQALSDLKRNREAEEHLLRWVERWERLGFGLFASAGALELANLYARKRRNGKGRVWFERGEARLPAGEPLPALFRPPEFSAGIRHALFPPPGPLAILPAPESFPLFIETFGGLSVRVGDTLLYDRQWRGKSTKTLLKALVAFGGNKVSADLLKDTLWPDQDGDRAEENLKVALSRLRRLGIRPGEDPPNWIPVRHGKVTLSRSHCAADSILFEEGIRASRNGAGGTDLLARTLGLYKEDFLPGDLSEEWIVRRRERLREAFLRGSIDLSERCVAAGAPEAALPFLRKALEKDPLQEGIYAALMRTHLAMGYPSKAARVFRQAREVLDRELGIAPGPVLSSLYRKTGARR